MPFCPVIPNNHMIPGMAPGHNKHAQSVVIKHVHAIVIHSSGNATTGLSPACEPVSGLGIPDYDCEKRLIATVTG
jgi:hypothetical protein